jgi:hypothetical protein
MDRTLDNAGPAPVDQSGQTWHLWHIASHGSGEPSFT